jgi:hypothetical protein
VFHFLGLFHPGFMYLSEGLEARSVDPKVALRYLTLAVKNFEDALTHNTSSKGMMKIPEFEPSGCLFQLF